MALTPRYDIFDIYSGTPYGTGGVGGSSGFDSQLLERKIDYQVDYANNRQYAVITQTVRIPVENVNMWQNMQVGDMPEGTPLGSLYIDKDELRIKKDGKIFICGNAGEAKSYTNIFSYMLEKIYNH